MITKRKAIANNKELKEEFDPRSPIWYLMYLGTYNLYGWAMCEKLPYRCCSVWYSEAMFNAVTENCTKDLSEAEFTFEVECDVDIPEHLHDAFNDFPYLAEKLIITDEMLSPSQLRNRGKPSGSAPVEKLVPNLLPKRNYICHYRILHQAVAAGLIVTKVHRAVKMYQSRWLASYIESNTKMRAAATNDSDKNFFKLMNNSVFGKFIENPRHRCNIELVNKNTARFSKLVAKNDFIRSIPIKDDLVFVMKHKTDVKLMKPIFIGAAVLDISKWLMYDFHYNFIKKTYPDAELLFTDTDSLLYQIPGSNCNGDHFESIYQHREHYDLSEVVIDKFRCSDNKKVLGKFKDELNFVPIKEFIGLRSKMYSVLADKPASNMTKAKGVKKSTVKKYFNHQLYSKVHSGEIENHTADMTAIRSNRHKVTTDHIVKSGLINFDDKRDCDDNINTLAFGHYKIAKQL